MQPASSDVKPVSVTMSIRKPLSTLIFVALAGLALAQDPNTVVATVNGDQITMGEYFRRLEWYHVDPQNTLDLLPVGFLALKQLITERIVFQMARDKGVPPTDPEIDAEEKAEVAKNPKLLSDMTSKGLSEDDLKEQIAYQLAQYNLQTYGITITDEEVEHFYHENPSSYKLAKRYKLRVIVVNDDDSSAAVDKDLASGKAFSEVAQQRSLDVSKTVGGEIGDLQVTDLGTPVVQALEGVKIGGTTPWVHGGPQDPVRVKYLVEDIIPEKPLPLDADLRKQIRKQLSLGKGSVKNNVYKDLEAATLAAKVAINRPGFQALYDQVIAKFKAAHPSGN